MRKLLVGLLALSSLSVFASEGTCKLTYSDGLSNRVESIHALSSDVQGEFVKMQVSSLPSLSFRARENRNNMVIISVEKDGQQLFFSGGQDKAYLAYYPDLNYKLKRIDISCSL